MPVAILILLLIPCWVIAWLYEVDIRTAYSAISRIPTELGSIYGPARGPELGRYFYPPFTLVLFSPLSRLPFLEFKLVWMALQTASYGVFWWCLYKLYPTIFRSPWPAVCVIVIAINPIHNNFQSNNIQIWLAAILLAAELMSRAESRRTAFSAGLLVALTVHIKVYPVFLALYYFLTACRSMRWGILSGGLIFLVLPFGFFSPESAVSLYRGFFANLTTYGAENSLTVVPDILCLPSLIARTLSAWLTPTQIASTTAMITSVVSGAFLLWAWRRRSKPTPTTWEMAWLLMALLNPSTRVHYFIFYVPAFCLWTQSLSRKNILNSAAFATSVALIAFTTEFVVGKSLNNRLEQLSLPTWGILILAAGVFSRIRNQSNSSHPQFM